MFRKTIGDFINELEYSPQRLLKIAELPMPQRKQALQDIGYIFASRDLDEFICETYQTISPKLGHLGQGDVRDIIMEKWGNCF